MKRVKFYLCLQIVFLLMVPQLVFSFSLPAGDTLASLPGYPAYITYGDFQSYSLPLLALNESLTNGGPTTSKNPYYVASSPGALNDAIVIATGANVQSYNDNTPYIDNFYDTPNETNGDATSFSTITAASSYGLTGVADPGGADQFLGDSENSWDINVSALNTYLDGSPLYFFFNNNQQGANITLNALAEVSLIHIGYPSDTQYFYFMNNYPAVPTAGDFIPGYNPGTPAQYVLSGASIPVTYTYIKNNKTKTKTVDLKENLGANQAAYALQSSALDSALTGLHDPADWVMQVQINLTGLNNGYEQVFIERGSSVVNTVVPEPATVLLLGFGLVCLAGIARKRMRA